MRRDLKSGKLVWVLMVVMGTCLVSCQRAKEKKREKPKHKPGVVALVNGEPILLKEVRREIGSEESSVDNATANFVLQSMIDQKLLLQEARRRGIKVSRSLIAKLAFGDRNATSIKEVRWEKRLEDLWLMGKVAEAICPVKPPFQEEIEAYYQAHKDRFFVKDGVVVRQIVLSTKEEAEKLRRALRRKGLKAFVKAAKEYSIGPEGTFGGKLGLIKRGDEPPGFEDVFNLKPGRVSKVVKTDYGYHLFFVEKRVKDWYLPLKDVQGEIKKMLVSQKGSRCLEEWLANARKKARIEISKEELMSLVGEGE